MKTLALINPAALPTLRIVGTIFLLISVARGAYLFRNRHQFFDRDPQVANDISAVRHLRVEVVLVPWLSLTLLLLVEWLGLWTS